MPMVLLGTCGWSYAEWEGILYPHAKNKLKQYSSYFRQPRLIPHSMLYRNKE